MVQGGQYLWNKDLEYLQWTLVTLEIPLFSPFPPPHGYFGNHHPGVVITFAMATSNWSPRFISQGKLGQLEFFLRKLNLGGREYYPSFWKPDQQVSNLQGIGSYLVCRCMAAPLRRTGVGLSPEEKRSPHNQDEQKAYIVVSWGCHNK